MNSDLLEFEPENDSVGAQPDRRTWKIALIDDDPEVLAVTRFALQGVVVDGRPLEFVEAQSGAEGRTLFVAHADIAMALIDVVMEDEEAGLDLIQWVRNELGNQRVRIVMRTGQPGQAPEDRVIRDYDINDYKNKSELTSQKLRTAVYSSIRSYRDIVTIEDSLCAMERLIACSTSILKTQTLGQFGSAVLDQLLALLNIERSAMLLIAGRGGPREQPFRLLAATGDFEAAPADFDHAHIPSRIRDLIDQAIVRRSSISTPDGHVAYYETEGVRRSALYLAHRVALTPLQQRMLDHFVAQATLVYQGLSDIEERAASERQLAELLGTLVERRDRRGASHARGTAAIAVELAKAAGLPDERVEVIALAAPLHDVGMLGVPGELQTSGNNLSDDQKQLMQSHTRLGSELLSTVDTEVGRVAATIALGHHERWDGAGYPQALAGDATPIEARIVGLANVIDALLSPLPYRAAWTPDAVLDYLRAERGREFDPALVDAAVSTFRQLLESRANLDTAD